MFGQRLKSWMEAHLGRPRHKSTSHHHHHHQNQKQRNSSKEISSLHSSACSGTGTTTSQSTGTTSVIGNNTSSVPISSPQPLYTNSNLNSASHNFQSHHLHSHSATEKNSNNSDRIPCPSQEDFSSTTAATSSSSALQAQQQQQQHQDHDHLLQQDGLDQEHLHHLNHQHHHHQQQLLQKHNSQLRGNQQLQQQQQQQPSVSTTAILLGSFSNNLNLSSPDTGYSTDGYSPKSVYPALSFESSGKSTPKSSYTISSLVSSERLHLNNSSSCTSSKSISGGGPSKNSSISNGLELEEEEVCCDIPSGEPTSMSMSIQTQSRDSMTTTAAAAAATTTHSDLSLLPEQQSDRGRKDDERSNGEGNHGQSITGIGIGPGLGPGPGTELKDDAKSNNLHLRSFGNSTGTDCSSGVINVNRTLPSFTEAAVSSAKTVESSAVELLVSNSKGNVPIPIPTQSHGFPCSEKHEHYNHRRTESMDEQRVRHEGIEISSSSSSKVTSASGAGGGGGGGGGRNIRTSLLLTSSSDIPPECNPGLKNAFSLCSPRRQRTRIKTNPWISLTQHHDINFHVHCRMGNKETSVVGLGPGSVPTGTNNVCSINFESVNGAEDETDPQNNFGGLCGGAEEEEQLNSTEGKMVVEINNAGAAANTEKNGSSGGGVGGGSEIVNNNNNNSTSIFYRISTSTSASDSGKGTLEPGTNRNSTESSCLLSDSTSGSNSGGSARNSIISPENTISSGSVSLIPNINSVHGRLEQCVSSLVPGQAPTSSSSSSAAVKPTSSAAPSICVNNSNSTKPISVKRLNSTSVIGIDVDGKVKSVGKRAEAVSSLAAVTSAAYATGDNFPSMVDKETDILSDWANTDDDDAGEEEEDEEDGDGDNDEDEEDDNECITPTPSSPDVTFNHSSSCSSKMEFIEVSDRVRHPNTNPNINLNGNKSGFMPGQGPYQHNMNLPTTCYQSVALSPKQCSRPLPVTIPLQIPDAYAYDHVNNLSHHRQQHNQPLGLGSQDIGETEVAPAGTTARCLNTRIPNNNTGLQSKNSHNHNASHTIARGAIGFFRKMFKKGSACSSQRNGSGFSGGKGKFLLRSSRSSNGSENDREDNDIDNNLIIPVGLLSPETVVVSNYPLSNTKPLSPAINGNFLTPTPNAFRRRSACPGGSDFTPNDAGRTAKLPHHTKAIKTDIIRLPPQATCSSSSFNSDSSANHHHHHRQGPMEQEPPSQSSSTTSHSISNSTGHPNPIHLASYNSPYNNNAPYYPLQSNTSSTTGSSSAHSMSIMSTSSMSMTEAQQKQKAIQKLPIFSQNHNIDDLIAYENLKHELLKPKPYPRQSQSQSPFMSNSNSIFSTHHHHQNNGAPSNYHNRPSHSSPMLPPKQVGHHNQTQIQNHNQGMIVLGPPKVCPYDSPRLPSNAGNSRISSPSFNNYSPIHRIVVTGGNHLLSRGGAPPTHGPPPPPSPAPPPSFHPAHNNNNHHHHSPVPPPRTPNSQLQHRPPPIPTTTHASPLINHRHSSSASTSTAQSNGTPGSNHHPFVTCSPSPILRNPRYQYITSSNQNSPLLNIPKRLSNVPLNNFPRGNVSLSNKVITTVPASPVPASAPAPVFHSPSFTRAPSHNTNSNSNSNESHYFKQNPSRGSPLNNSMAPNHHRQTHRAHIQNTNNNTNHLHKNQSHPSKGIFPPRPSRGPDGFHTNHYYSSPITRDTSQSQSKFSRSNGMIPNRERGQERIYETVDDSEEEEDDLRSDEGDGEGGVFEFRVPEFGQEVGRREQESDVRRQSQRRGVFVESDSFAMINPSHHAHGPGRNSTTTMNSGGSSSGGGGSGGSSSQRCKSKSTSKSKSRRSKREQTFSPIPQPQPPLPPRSFPLMLGTYLSETETQLLEADRNTDRKYKRLISEAEALLREISIEKTQPLPWLSRYARESLRHDDCPQSDPLRRKAYDCWALRRLQQELAGCCASPPVLHRSRLHITSPVSPSQNRNFSLAQDLPEFPFMQDRRSSISSIHSHTHSNAPY